MLKRTIDIFLSLAGMIVLLPLFPIIALLIKLDSKGPVFYPGNRVGKDSKIFKMYKLRTMIDTPVQVGESICPEYDPRVTTFGRFLRRTKLNEFPQLINILKGDMTFVGPRPETPDLAELYPEEAKKVFSVTPGLVGPNQILGRNEEELYPPGVDVRKYYIEKILPGKVRIDLEYIGNPCIFKDLKYIFLGVKETLVGTLDRKCLRDNRSQIYLLLADIALSIFSLTLAYAISFHSLAKGQDLILFSKFLLAVILIRTGFFVYLGMYNTLIRYISYHDIVKVLKSVTCGSILLIMFSLAFRFHGYPRMLIMDWGCLILFLSGLRFGIRFYWEKQHLKNGTKKTKRVLIFGAGNAGDLACRSLTADKDNTFEVAGFIDDAPGKYGKTLQGLKVLGNGHHIKALAQLHKAEEIILAMPGASAEQINKIVRICQDAGLRSRFFSFSGNSGSLSPRLGFPIRAVGLSDILPLKKIRMDKAVVEPILAGKTVLITGSGGALGLELCRRILGLGCKKLIIIEQYESYLTELVAGLLNFFPKESVVPVLIATDRIDPLEEVFAKHRPDVVFHTSMRKYIPFFEVNNDDIAWINYVRTLHLTNLASKFQSEFFVMVSSMAACNNSNFICDSLCLAELCVQQFLDGTKTRPVIARICDIVENRGGIVSIMEDQIRKQEAVTLPYPQAPIHLLSKTSAAEFILQTLAESGGMTPRQGAFVCETGSAITCAEVAEKLADLYELKLGIDLPISDVDLSKQDTALETGLAKKDISYIPTGHADIKFVQVKGIVSSESFKETLDSFVQHIDKGTFIGNWATQTQQVLGLDNRNYH